MSLRARLVVVVAAAVAAAVVLASLLVFFLVRSELYRQVDRSLRNQRDQIASSPGRGLATQIRGCLTKNECIDPTNPVCDPTTGDCAICTPGFRPM